MDELLQGLYTRYLSAAGAALRAIVTAMYPSMAVQATVAPYVTYMVLSCTQDDNMETEQYIPLVRFSIWDDQVSPARGWSAVEELRDLYRDFLPTLANWKAIRAQVQQPGIALWDEPTKSWGFHVEILYRIGR